MTPKVVRDQSLPSMTIETQTPCPNQDFYVTVSFSKSGEPLEVFLRSKKSGTCEMATTEVVGRMISLALRSGANPVDVFKNLRGINCNRTCFINGEMAMSCWDATALAYMEAWEHAKRESGQMDLDFDLTREQAKAELDGPHTI